MGLAIPLTLDKKLVTLAIFVSVIGIGITITLSFHYSNLILEERIMDQLLSESTIRGDAIRNLFDSRLQQIQVIGTDPMIRNLINSLNVVDDEYVLTERVAEKRIDFLIQIQAFEATIGGLNELENVEIIGNNGKELFSLINTKNKKNFLTDEKFVNGGTTNANPNVYALISDESGINTAGNGIGHDITISMVGASIDDNKFYTANDFFEADLDSYQKGKINFPLSGLSDVKHTLKLKVWDIFNNSSEATIEFYVITSKEISLNHVYNYPNPFTTHTTFMFEHNRACVPMTVQVQIFTVTGKLIKTISKTMVCDGFRNDNLDWDGRDDYGDKIGRGIYVYRLRVKTSDGFTADKMEKLVIL